jgi:hypothetical protein
MVDKLRRDRKVYRNGDDNEHIQKLVDIMPEDVKSRVEFYQFRSEKDPGDQFFVEVKHCEQECDACGKMVEGRVVKKRWLKASEREPSFWLERCNKCVMFKDPNTGVFKHKSTYSVRQQLKQK